MLNVPLEAMFKRNSSDSLAVLLIKRSTVMSTTPVNVQSIEFSSQKESTVYENEEEKEKGPVEIGDGGNEECSMRGSAVTEATNCATRVSCFAKKARARAAKTAGAVV